MAEPITTSMARRMFLACQGLDGGPDPSVLSTVQRLGYVQIDTIAVACLDGEGCSPCGNCRQLMREFRVRRVILTTEDGTPVEYALEELLPRSFGPDDLRSSRSADQ